MDAGGTEIDADGAETEVDAEVASILGEPEVVAALDARLPVSGSEVVDLCTPTPDAPGPSAGDKRPAPDSGSQRPNRKAKMEAAAKVAQCAESDRAPSREGIGEMHTFKAFKTDKRRLEKYPRGPVRPHHCAFWFAVQRHPSLPTQALRRMEDWLLGALQAMAPVFGAEARGIRGLC